MYGSLRSPIDTHIVWGDPLQSRIRTTIYTYTDTHSAANYNMHVYVLLCVWIHDTLENVRRLETQSCLSRACVESYGLIMI